MVIYWEGVAEGDIQDGPFFQSQSGISSGGDFLFSVKAAFHQTNQYPLPLHVIKEPFK